MRVFISYRRADSSGYVPALASVLQETRIPDEPCEVFLDVDRISPGRNFIEAMNRAMENSDVVLAVVGRHWLMPDGRRRLDDKDDFVRAELRTAIEMAIPLVVVLVDGGTVPDASELPADIAAVTRTKQVHLRDTDAFEADVETLLSVIRGFGRRPGRAPSPSTLRLVHDGRIGWLSSDDRRDVRVDRKRVGTIAVGPDPTEFILPAGTHSVTVGRGLAWAEKLTVTMEPGQVTTLAYHVRALGKTTLRVVTP